MKALLSEGRSLPAVLPERVPVGLPEKFKSGRDLSPVRIGLPAAVEMTVSGLRVERYGSRFWAVWDGPDLICVTVYRKGARSVLALLTTLMEEVGRGSN
jgi:hypothetical protein